MAAFSHQQQNHFLLDNPYLPNASIEMPFLTSQVEEISNASFGIPYCFSSQSIPGASRITDNRTYESSCSLGSGTKVGGTESQIDHSVVVLEPRPQASMEKKRKSGYWTSMSPSQLKESMSRKQKKPSGGLKGTEKNSKRKEKKETKACEEPPVGYVHVRARRGQATDSHSLAERVRREKISVRMKVLQGLVPGCDKVVGKALMLDEIINYVQSLQNQVEFLSMKLASMNPVLYDFAVDFDDCMNQTEKFENIVQPLPPAHQTNHILATAPGEATGIHQLVNPSTSPLLHGQGSIIFTEDNTGYPMHADDQCMDRSTPTATRNQM